MVRGDCEVAGSLPGWKGLRQESGAALLSTGQENGAQRSGKSTQGHRALWQSRGRAPLVLPITPHGLPPAFMALAGLLPSCSRQAKLSGAQWSTPYFCQIEVPFLGT